MTKLATAVLTGTALLCSLPWLLQSAPAASFEQPPSFEATTRAVRPTLGTGGSWGDLVCMTTHCSAPAAKCMLDHDCRETSLCNAKCQGKPNELACDLLCELTSGYNSTVYREMLVCMSAHKCLPVQPGSDGVCLAQDNETIPDLTDMSQIPGKWWILRGMNCGQNSKWPAGFDAFPCQRDEFVLENGKWIDHIAYCGGNVSETQECKTEIVNTQANVSITSPGVMTHWYTDAPLLPQNEEWRVLSWPDQGDWMLYIYCGYTPTGAYAGGSVVSRTARSMAELPAKYEAIFREATKKYGFDYDEMCVSDLTNCKD